MLETGVEFLCVHVVVVGGWVWLREKLNSFFLPLLGRCLHHSCPSTHAPHTMSTAQDALHVRELQRRPLHTPNHHYKRVWFTNVEEAHPPSCMDVGLAPDGPSC